MRFWRDLSIQNKVLVIILPLIIVPMLILATVGFVTSSREAAKTANRYSPSGSRSPTIAENPAIRVTSTTSRMASLRKQRSHDANWNAH